MRRLRVLILCLLVAAIGLSGPLARSFAMTPAKLHDLAVAERALETAHAGSTMDFKVASARPCERPLFAWTNCSTDNGVLPLLGQATFPGAGEVWEKILPAPIVSVAETRHFRPPRLG